MESFSRAAEAAAEVPKLCFSVADLQAEFRGQLQCMRVVRREPGSAHLEDAVCRHVHRTRPDVDVPRAAPNVVRSLEHLS